MLSPTPKCRMPVCPPHPNAPHFAPPPPGQPALALEFARTHLAPHVAQQPDLLAAYKAMTAGLVMGDSAGRFASALLELRLKVQSAVEGRGGARAPQLEPLLESLLEYHRRWFVLQHSYDRCV